MSFSSQIKSELEKIIPSARHCQLAELSALYKFCNKDVCENDGFIVLSSENELLIQKCFTLLKKTFNIYKDFVWADGRAFKEGSVYQLKISETDKIQEIINALDSVSITMKACCKRAYIRGAYLAIGSMSDPEKSYHLEWVCNSYEDAENLGRVLESFSIEAKIVQRKKYYVLYIKDGTMIVDVLNVMGAHVAMMELENTRILKEVRNSVNRKLNCEMANIGKTVSASQKQIEAIQKLMGLNEDKKLPDSLKNMAELRMEYPEASLKELGELSEPPIGKSGVNHRLRKLCEIAEKYISLE